MPAARSPWLSVLMPIYNGEAYLTQALDSILAQGDPDIEVLAIEGASTDGTLSILRAYEGRLPLRVLEAPQHSNWVKKTNRGISEARGDYVCFLHHDDLWRPGRLAALRKATLAHPGAVFVVHDSLYINSRGRVLGLYQPRLPDAGRPLPHEIALEHFLTQNIVTVPATLFRRDALSRVGPLDESLWYTADWDLWIRLAGAGPTLYVPRSLCAYRLHAMSQTSTRGGDPAEIRSQYSAVAERHLSAWRIREGRPCPAEDVARFSVRVNAVLASLAARRPAGLGGLAAALLRLGPAEAWRYARRSRILQRVAAYVRGRLWRRSTS